MKLVRFILLLIFIVFSAAEEKLTVGEESPVWYKNGHYRWNVNFKVPNMERDWGVIVQRIDVLYEITDKEGKDITDEVIKKGKQQSFYEVFLITPTGYSYEVDTFQDRNFGDDTNGKITVWASAIYIDFQNFFIVEPQSILLLQEVGMKDFLQWNTMTQAGEIPSSVEHLYRPFHPIVDKFNTSENVVYRKAEIEWKGGEWMNVYTSSVSMNKEAWPGFWQKHVFREETEVAYMK